MELTAQLLDRLVPGMTPVQKTNAAQLAAGVKAFPAGLTKPHRLAAFLANVFIESGWFKYDRELWGPTAAQKRYDTRTDLGNTPAADGDGFLNRGMGPLQLTGGYNRDKFHAWAVERFGAARVPVFRATEALLDDPWEGLSAVWYWDEGSKGRTLNRYADVGDFENVVRGINGGLTHFDERSQEYGSIATTMLGYTPGTADTRIKNFQKDNGLTVDGIVGTNTRKRLHEQLVALGEAEDKDQPLTIEDRLAAIETRLTKLETPA